MNEQPIDLGKKIRRERKELGFTLDEVARRSEVAMTTISKIERNMISPSFNTLAKIAKGMNVKVTQLISDEAGEETVVVKQSERATLNLTDPPTKVESLTRNVDYLQVEAVEVFLNSGQEIGSDESPPGEDLILCQKGTVELQIGSATYTLKKGDSVHFKPNKPTWLRNSAKSQATVLWVFSPAGPPAANTRTLTTGRTESQSITQASEVAESKHD